MDRPDPAMLKELEEIERRFYRLPGAERLNVPIRLLRWLRSLVGVAAGLRRGFYKVVRLHIDDLDAAGIDLLAVDRLLGRARLWMRALRARLTKEAAKMGLPPDRRDTDDSDERLLAVRRAGRTGAPRRPRLSTVFGAMPTAAVVAQICADLSQAARLLGKTAAAKRIATIAEELLALLAGASTAIVGAEASPVGHGAAGALGGVIAPDSG